MSTVKPLASIIMTTYNAPIHLELAVAALQVQSELNFELHIADDGSTEETANLVKRLAAESPFPIIYSWQEDKGYRKTKILNEAIKKAQADYLIFIDGDCVVHRDFIKHHLEYRQPGYYLAGRRVDLGPVFSQTLTPHLVKNGDLNGFNFSLWKSCLSKDSSYFHRAFPVTNPLLRKILKMEKVDDMKGCNFSVDKESVIKINGFDEDYEGYAREDTDLELRLQYLGLKIKSLKGLAIQYHVWHPRLPESEGNKLKLKEISHVRSASCKNGLQKLSAMLVCSMLFLGGCASRHVSTEESAEFEIIDAHTHTVFGETIGNGKSSIDLPAKSEADYFQEMKDSHVVGAVAHTVPLANGAKGEAYYKDLQSRNVIHCIGIGKVIDVHLVKEGVDSGKYGCIKIYLGYIHRFAFDKIYEPLYQIAQKYDVPVVFHTGDTYDMAGKLKYADPLTIDEVAVDHPKVRFVIAHCGNPWLESAAEVAYKNPNVYLDGSGLMVGDLSQAPIEKVNAYLAQPIAWVFGYLDNPGKLMFGTDWPLTTMKGYIEAFKRAIPPKHWKAVFYDNAYRVFNFDRMKK